jgi:hypothetical protein
MEMGVMTNYDPTFEIDRAEDSARREESSRILANADSIIEDALCFVRRYIDFQPDASEIAGNLDALLKAIRPYGEPECDMFDPAAAVLGDKLAAMVLYSGQSSSDPMVVFWRNVQ